ncbi:hypothetical protein POM88_051750 [Heracleum sosnowskyi]|uniref:TGS domain-containing protein n=1 Tax=Heracleum sosnowskyi TaxID=360622 RepID=A0AAD8H128_9APIA|nr:hypothetical protein POM88_051750 [Heracleum sosnowskyi]
MYHLLLFNCTILVLNKELWKSVSDVYKKEMNVTEIGFSPYGVFENLFSFNLLESDVDVVAAMDVRNDVVFKSSLSWVITMVSYACFWRGVREFVGFVLNAKDSGGEFVGEPMIRRMKDWGTVSRQVHAGVKVFDLSVGDYWLFIRGKKEKLSIFEIGDPSGYAKLKAKNEQVGLLLKGITVLLLNARIVLVLAQFKLDILCFIALIDEIEDCSKRIEVVEDFCNHIHRILVKEVKYVLVWGTSARHNPQNCGLSQVLQDEDVVQIVKKKEKKVARVDND